MTVLPAAYREGQKQARLAYRSACRIRPDLRGWDHDELSPRRRGESVTDQDAVTNAGSEVAEAGGGSVRSPRRRRYRKSDPRYTPEHDFKWRARIRANPQSYLVYRWVVFAVGLIIVVVGLALVPLPGPGWFIVILGLLIWASEFERAQRLLDFVRERLLWWNVWIMSKGWPMRLLLGLLTFAFVCAVVWTVVKFTGSVAMLPDPYETWLRENLRL